MPRVFAAYRQRNSVLDGTDCVEPGARAPPRRNRLRRR